jgi:SAM-dependent methyltransferase
MAEAILRWLQLTAGLTWLDVGCGTGALTAAILQQAAPRAIAGMDPSAAFLENAQAHITDSRAHFAVATAAELPFPDGSFDVAIAGLVLHFVPDPLTAVTEMARVVRDSGTVAGYVWDFAGERQFTHTFWSAAIALDADAANLDPRVQFTICAPDSLTDLFTSAGLQDVVVESVVMPVTFTDFDDYWQPHLLAGSSPAQRYANSLDEADLATLRMRLLATLPIAADGSIPLLGRVWAVRGRK